MKRVVLLTVGMALILWVGCAFADDSHFVFYDLTVKDKQTGLTWARDANLSNGNLNNAHELVKKLNMKNYAGFKDWRLPSVDELKSLLAFSKELGFADWESTTHRPYHLLNQMGFYDVQTDNYWSSTTDEKYPDMGHAVGFEFGQAGLVRSSTFLGIWPVRGEYRK